ncbi:MAG: PQQ-dependent dehydrogenase, methanol/ethanol family [Pseudomonadota bacterium]
MSNTKWVFAISALVFAVGCEGGPARINISEASLNQAEATISGSTAAAGDWAKHGLNHEESRHSSLTTINRSNVSELALAWYVDLPTKRGQEASPLIIDGVMYTTSAWSHVIALDAATGETLWHFDPQVPKSYGAKGCCDAVNRGVAVENGRVYVGTLDGRLIALDAATGAPIWSKLTVDQSKQYTITGAPRVHRGRVFIGNGGAEYGVRGYLSAYDAEDGELLWRFYTVPGGPGDPRGTEPVESQTATWSGEWWKLGGGGTVWDSMAIDTEANLLFFGVGNGSPWNPNIRSAGKGDNWFLSSIVAVDAVTGEYRWHYQTTPGDAWDYTATQHIILADIEIAGELRKVLMQAPKNGFFYVLDRISGELISAEPYVDVNWATHVDMKTGRPAVRPEAEYWKTGVPTLIAPAWMGGHNWHPMSYSPDSGLVYLPAQETSFPYFAEDDQQPSRIAVNLGVDTKVAAFPDEPAAMQAIKDATRGHLLAWDPITQTEVWRAQYPGIWNGGLLSTAGGLVFQGSAAGYLYAYHADTGERLWEFAAQTGIVAPPVTYAVGGEQYLAVSAGWGGIFPLMSGPLVEDAAGADPVNRSRLLVFKLGGEARLPTADATLRNLATIDEPIDMASASKGFAIYDRYCINCHGAGAVGGGVIPDLRYSPITPLPDVWQKIVLEGVLEDSGMIGFGAELSPSDAESIRHFVMDRVRRARYGYQGYPQ